ncbi:syntaxin-like protein [Auriculariales sp. MPI-PUGE-AT-0066]|nr:syntaxin-like protein [Auriculariales sp. MPI-PUGE-AT-0066]
MSPLPPPRGQDDTTAFFDEVSSIQGSIRQFSSLVQQISDAQSRSLNAISGSDTARTQLESLFEETRVLSNKTKDRIRELERRARGDAQWNQAQLLREKFKAAVEGFQVAERDHRQKQRDRIARQVRIVRPDATPEEVKAVAESGDVQVFQQELLNSNRYGDSRAAYREVQARHEDIQNIERTLLELGQLFQDLAYAVERQDEQVKVIKQNAYETDKNIEAGNEQMDKAIRSARNARRMKWICFWITVVVVSIVVLILVVYFLVIAKQASAVTNA